MPAALLLADCCCHLTQEEEERKWEEKWESAKNIKSEENTTQKWCVENWNWNSRKTKASKSIAKLSRISNCCFITWQFLAVEKEKWEKLFIYFIFVHWFWYFFFLGSKCFVVHWCALVVVRLPHKTTSNQTFNIAFTHPNSPQN